MDTPVNKNADALASEICSSEAFRVSARSDIGNLLISAAGRFQRAVDPSAERERMLSSLGELTALLALARCLLGANASEVTEAAENWLRELIQDIER